MPDCHTPITQCRWILTYTVAYSRHEQSTHTAFMESDSSVLHRIASELCGDFRTLIGFHLTANPAYEQSRQS